MTSSAKHLLLHDHPDSSEEIIRIADKLLVCTRCAEVLPTPINHLFEYSKIKEFALPTHDENFLSRFSERARSVIKGLIQRVRGAADLRKRVVYVAQQDNQPRIQFARAHELGHQTLPWHRINRDYLDDNQTLSPDVKKRFEKEANFFASEIIFQGKRFQVRARDYRTSFDSIYQLAEDHGASRHATFWRFVEEQNEPVAGLMYYPIEDENFPEVSPKLQLWNKVVCSNAYRKHFSSLTHPGVLPQDHPWAAALGSNGPVEDEIFFTVDGVRVGFFWQSWWNSYTLLVLLRKKPLLHIVGKLLSKP